METGDKIKPSPLAMETIENVKAEVDPIGRDIALQLVASSCGQAIVPEQEKRVLRKIDIFLIPFLVLTYMLQYVDKVILNGASQFGIIQDLHLYEVSGIDPATHQPILNLRRFSNATLIFYWGCLAGLLPASYLAQRIPIAKFISCTVTIWGAMVMLTVLCSGYYGFLVQRFFLGFAECAVAPGFTIMISMWWKRSEQPFRYSIWYTSTGLGSLFGSLIVYGIGPISGALSPWKYQYLILGAFTILWGLIMLGFLPDNPVNARFLKQDERVIAIERKRHEHIGIENKTFKFYQIKEALIDPKTWMMFLICFCLHFVNGAVSGFGAIIVTSFGFSHLHAILLTGAVGACVTVTLIVIGVTSTYFQNIRTILIIVCEIPVILGSVLVWKTSWVTHRGSAIAGFILLGTFAGAYMMLLSLNGANTAGHTQKVFVSGLLWVAWAISNGIAPLTIETTQANEHYPSAFEATIATASLALGGSLALRFYLQRENTVRDRKHGTARITVLDSEGFMDYTDRENYMFRYVL